MTYANFKLAVQGFANRTTADLQQSTLDMILVASNMAKLEAQRRRKFKMARATGFIAASGAGTEISTMTTAPGSGAAVNVRSIERLWLFATNGSTYSRARAVKMVSPEDVENYYPSANAGELNPAQVFDDPNTIRAFVMGTKLYVIGLGTATGVYLMADVVPMLADYDGSNTDFFLTYHYDWLIAKTVDYLNIFLKEDQRVSISAAKLELAWTSVCSFDDEFATGNDDAATLE